MASHTGQKWSRFFYSTRDFFIQVDISFSSWGFQLSRDLFYLSRDVSTQVEIFFIQVEMFQFKSKSFFFKLRCCYSSRDFFMSKFLFQVENIFFMSRFLFQVEVFISCQHFSFQEENFFLSQVEIFVLFEVKWTFLNSRRDLTQEYLLPSPGNDKSNKITWRRSY